MTAADVVIDARLQMYRGYNSSLTSQVNRCLRSYILVFDILRQLCRHYNRIESERPLTFRQKADIF